LTNKFSVELLPTGEIKCSLGVDPLSTISTITLFAVSSWNLVSVSFTTTPLPLGYQSIFVSVNGILERFWTDDSQSPISFDFVNDKVILGGPNGFLGQLSQFHIYNPGTQLFHGIILFESYVLLS